MERIIFEGGVCKVVDEKLLYETTTEAMMDQYKSRMPIKTKICPRGMIYYEKKESNFAVYVVEKTPRLTRFKWREGDTVEVYRLSMPFIYFMVVANESSKVIKDVFPFSTKKPIEAMEDEVFVAPLPNIYDGGQTRFCLGEVKHNVTDPLYKSINTVLDGIYSSNWNKDLSFSFPEKITSFKEWHEKSVRNGLFWNDLNYIKHNQKTFGRYVETVLKNASDS